MGLKYLILVLGSLWISNANSQHSFPDVAVITADGAIVNLKNILHDNSLIHVVRGQYCIGCVDYISSKGKNVITLFVIDEFGVSATLAFPRISGGSTFFVSLSDCPIPIGERSALLYIGKNEIGVIKEQEVLRLSDNYGCKKALFRRRVKYTIKQKL